MNSSDSSGVVDDTLYVCMECEEEFIEKDLTECNTCKESFCKDCIGDHLKECSNL